MPLEGKTQEAEGRERNEGDASLSPLKQFLFGILPVDYTNWAKLSAVSRLYEVGKVRECCILDVHLEKKQA